MQAMGTNEQPSAAPIPPFALPGSSEPENRCCHGRDSPHPKSGIPKTGRTDHPANNPSLPAACGKQGLPERIRLETSLSQWHGCRGNSLMLHHWGFFVVFFFLLPWISATGQPVLAAGRRHGGGPRERAEHAGSKLPSPHAPMSQSL